MALTMMTHHKLKLPETKLQRLRKDKYGDSGCASILSGVSSFSLQNVGGLFLRIVTRGIQ
jgi:hypothetical protein